MREKNHLLLAIDGLAVSHASDAKVDRDVSRGR
jgi:hypothetical protein